jgi:hypothetical protein
LNGFFAGLMVDGRRHAAVAGESAALMSGFGGAEIRPPTA